MSKEKTLVPKLRFKDFDNEWERNPIGSVFTFKQGVQCPIEEQFSEPSSGLIRFIRIIDLTQPNEPPRYIKDPGKNHHVKDSELFMVRYGSPGLIGFGHEGVIANNLFRLLPTDLERHDMTFYSQLLGSLKKQIDAVSGSSTMPAISFTTLRAIHITTPTLPEQKKIAAFLTSVDDRIDQLKRKKSLLQDYKKGVMQKLFSQELRFKDYYGNPYPDWEEKKLGEVATFLNGRAYKKPELLGTGKYPVLRVGNFFTNDHWYYSDLELESNKYCDNGDLLYAWSASFGPRIWEGGKVIYHYHIWKVLPRDNAKKEYLYHYMVSDVDRIKSDQGAGIAMMHVTKQGMEQRQILIPTLPEQTKIANFLTTLDSKIEQATTQITETQDFKKGLLQQMFV